MSVEHSHCKINLVTEKMQFAQLKTDWNSLVAAGHYAITNTWEWLFSWWEIYNENRELYIITFTINNNIVAIFPFQRVKDNSYFLNRKVIRFLGSGEKEEDETCSEYIDLIIACEHRESIIPEFIKYLQASPDEWDCVLLTDIRATSPNLEYLAQQKITGIALQGSESEHKAPYIDLPETWDELLMRTRINAREQLNRKLNLINKQGDIVFKRYQGSEITESVYERFIELHQKRWEMTEKPGCFSSQLFTAFHKKLIGRLAEASNVIIYFMTINNKAIAARYCFDFDHITYDYQTGLDMGFESKSSPGTLLLAHVIKDSISRKNHKYDFFKGKKNSYKYKWTDKDQALVSIVLSRHCFNNTLFNILGYRAIIPRMVRLLLSR